MCSFSPIAVTVAYSHLHLPQPSVQVRYSMVVMFDMISIVLFIIGQYPQNLQFDNVKMRPHLLACLEKGEIQPFPSKQVKRKERIKKRTKIDIFCKCRTQEGGTEWFHEDCLKVIIPNLIYVVYSMCGVCCIP